MKGWIGAVLLIGCLSAIMLIRARNSDGSPALLRSDAAQSAFVMAWLVTFVIGAAFVIEHYFSWQ
jgi:hypothetical protein